MGTATERVFSGIQPTGELHLGNYFGALQRWVALQQHYVCTYCIVDYHALTRGRELLLLAERTRVVARTLLACGIDPERSLLFVQSHVPEHTELAWVLNCFAAYGDLLRMTQFKDKARQAQFVSAGLFDYPVLQAADILLYRATHVPIGADQLQHLELARRIAHRFNHVVGVSFFADVIPLLSEAGRVMSLARPTQKMSKSLGPRHYIGLLEPRESVCRKIMTAVTDTGQVAGTEPSPGVENLFALLRATAPHPLVEELATEHRRGILMYRRLKEAVCEHVMRALQPIQERYRQLTDEQVREVLMRGAEQARVIARATMDDLRGLLGVGTRSL